MFVAAGEIDPYVANSPEELVSENGWDCLNNAQK